jgi:hypothetical protein
MTRRILASLSALAATSLVAITLLVFSRESAPAATSAAELEMLATPAGPGSAEPNLTVGQNGKLYLSWLERAPDTTTSLRFSVFEGSKWSPAQVIRKGRDFMVNWADFPAMSVHKSGKMAVHWLQNHGVGAYAYDIRIATSSDAGKTWSAGVAPHVDRSSTEKGFAVFWPETDGFGAVWLDGRKADKAGKAPIQEMMLMATTKAGVEPAAETRLDERVCDCCQTTTALTSDGPIIAYRDRSADEIRDISVVRRVGGKWTAPQPVSNDNWKINACPVNGPSIAAAGKRVALAWYTAANDVPRVKFAFSTDAGATFGAPVTIDEGKPSGRVATVLLTDGSALVSWIERTGGDTAVVRVRRVTPQGRAMEPTTVAPSSAGAAGRESRATGFPRMAASGEHIYFAWTAPGRPTTVQVARAKASTFR